MMDDISETSSQRTTNSCQYDRDSIPVESIHKNIKSYSRRKGNKWTLLITFSSLVLIIIFITIAYLVAKQKTVDKKTVSGVCSDGVLCNMTIVETIPDILQYKEGSPLHDKISSNWMKLIDNAKHSINILSFYWTMKDSDVDGGPYKQSEIGSKILECIKNAARRGVKIRIVQNKKNVDTDELAKEKNIDVRTLSVKKFLNAGIVHTKFFSVDDKNAYVGSANFDWRALTEVKELGVVMYDCSCSVGDVNKIFETNWFLANAKAIPHSWDRKYRTIYNKDNPITVHRNNGSEMKVYWSASPPAFCTPQRTSDIQAILNMIRNAKKFIHIAVMDYYAAFIYIKPQKYWDVIDRELRAAVFDRKVEVHLMTSKWPSTRPQQIVFLTSLNDFGKLQDKGELQVKLFEMPNSTIPYTHVSHAKYMVTENEAFVSTSNWSGDYFNNTGGISLVIKDTTMHSQLVQTFQRDWESKYAHDL